MPENRVLSHDLLEGGYARSGLVSDVLLFEDYPSSYPADMSRRSRWVRGDWQIAPWLMPRVRDGHGQRVRNPLSGLSRWKILDNIRRSLMPAALLGLLVLGWLLPGAALLCTVIVAAILLLPAVLNGAAELRRRPADLPIMFHARQVAYAVTRQVLQQAFVLASLPYDATVSLDAIRRTLFRLLLTGRGLLEWRTAREAQRSVRSDLAGFYSLMWIAPLTAALALLVISLARRDALAIAAPVIGSWFVAPAVAFLLSRPIRAPRPHLTAEDLSFLGMVSRRTWRYFETFVDSDDNHLPPDNFQEDPPKGVAHRTSPTNIGMSLLANLAAYDFGYIPVTGVIERTTRTLATLDKLQRYRGHFYNWYDTRTLEPLRPLYVSTVDSGNLAAHLLTLASGLDELANDKIFRPAVALAGLGWTLEALLETARTSAAPAGREVIARLERLRDKLRTPAKTLADCRTLLQQVANASNELASTLGPNADDELKWWPRAVEQQCHTFLQDLDELASSAEIDLSGFHNLPSLSQVAQSESTPLSATDSGNGNVATLRSAVTRGLRNCRETHFRLATTGGSLPRTGGYRLQLSLRQGSAPP